MNSDHPFISTASVLFTCVLFAGLGIWAYTNRGVLFSPGELSAKGAPGKTLSGFDSHADFYQECGRCHQPFKGSQAVLCLECHSMIADQIDFQEGIHSQVEDVAACHTCHVEHRGEEFDPRPIALASFDHTRTDFSLIWHQLDFEANILDCESCHLEENYSPTNSGCVNCHGNHDEFFIKKHRSNYPQECIACHDGADRMTRFDHQLGSFPLDGAHRSAACESCHAQGQFENISVECAGCHQDPPKHIGVFSDNCGECHTVQSWLPAFMGTDGFEHEASTSFSLKRHTQNYDDSPITCLDCHSSGELEFDPNACIRCHSTPNGDFLQSHQEKYSPLCLDCHDGVDRMEGFKHDEVFLLDGSHVDLECEGCHLNKIFGGTSRDCVQCHAEPEIHFGFFGRSCQYCHDAQSWSPAALRVHIFPLDHGDEGEARCETCHLETYAEFTCFSCHAHTPEKVVQTHSELNLAQAELEDCAGCHQIGVIESLNPGIDSAGN